MSQESKIASRNILLTINELRAQINEHIGVFVSVTKPANEGDKVALLECIMASVQIAAIYGAHAGAVSNSSAYKQFLKNYVDSTNEVIRGIYGFPEIQPKEEVR